MEWYLRLVNGLPPRKKSNDVINFKNTFPEWSTNSYRKGLTYFPFSVENIHKEWHSKKYRHDNIVSEAIECSVDDYPLKKNGGTPEEEYNDPGKRYMQFIGGKFGDAKTKDPIDYVLAIKDHFSKCDNQNAKALYIDPYLFKSCFPKGKNAEEIADFSKVYIEQLKQSIRGDWTLLSTYKGSEIENEKTLSDELKIKCIAIEEGISHDRFILRKINDDCEGVSVGASVNALNRDPYYIISKITEKDSEKLWEIFSNYLVSSGVRSS